MPSSPSTLISFLALTLTLTLLLNLTTVLAATTPPPPANLQQPPAPGPAARDPITCYATPGPGLIAVDDCLQALATTPFRSPSGPSGYRIGVDEHRTFRYAAAGAGPDGALSALPQSYSHGTCSIFLDLPLASRSAQATWADIEGWIFELVQRCVGHENGLAGKSRRGPVTVTLFKRGLVGGLRGSLGPEGAALMDRLTGGKPAGQLPPFPG